MDSLIINEDGSREREDFRKEHCGNDEIDNELKEFSLVTNRNREERNLLPMK